MNASYFLYLKELASKSGLHEDPRIERMIHNAAKFYEEKPSYRRWLEELLLRAARERPTPFVRPPIGVVDGGLRVGINRWSGSVGIGDLESLQHTFIAGATGAGKTVLTYNLASKLIEAGKSVWFFDFKQDARHLITDYPSLHPLRPKDLRFNPLASPLEKKKFSYGEKMWELLCQEEDLLSGSRGFGQELLEGLYEEIDPYPTLFDLIACLKKRTFPQGPRRSYKERLLTRSKSLTSQANFGKTFGCSKGFDIAELENSNLSLELEGLSTTSARFLALSLLATVYLRRLWSGHRREEPDLFVFMDESNQLLPSQWDYKLGTSFLDLLIERCREFGIALIATSHDLRVTHSILSNSNLKVALRLDEGEDIEKMAGSMGLEEDQKEVIPKLGQGQSVWKKSRGWSEPYLTVIEPYSLEKEVTDRDLGRHNQKFLNHLMDSVAPREKKEEEEEEEEVEEEKERDFEEELLLNNIVQFPFISLQERRGKLGWGSSKLNRVRKSLREDGYIRKKRLNRGGKGGAVALLEITGKGVHYVQEEMDLEAGAFKKRGGIIHTYWVKRLINHYQGKDWDVREEVELEDGPTVDLLLVGRDGEVVAVEVETTDPKNTVRKADSLLSHVDRLVVVSDKRVVLNQLEELREREEVQVRKVQDML